MSTQSLTSTRAHELGIERIEIVYATSVSNLVVRTETGAEYRLMNNDNLSCLLSAYANTKKFATSEDLSGVQLTLSPVKGGFGTIAWRWRICEMQVA